MIYRDRASSHYVRHPGLAAQRCRPEPLRVHQTRVGTAPSRNSRRRWASKARKRGDVLSYSGVAVALSRIVESL